MSPERLKAILDELDWSIATAARQLGCQPRVVRRWLGVDPMLLAMPPEVAEWFEALYAAHRANPPPASWKRRAA